MRIGITEIHGAYDEVINDPQASHHYLALIASGQSFPFLRSPIKGYFRRFDDSQVDLVESVISPVVTSKPWIYSLAVFQEALAFEVMGLPTPKKLRRWFVEHLLMQSNCRQLVFWSHAGKRTLSQYGGVNQKKIIDKSSVVYPAIGPRTVHDTAAHIPFTFLFSGDFFRKGGASVVDAFIRLKSQGRCRLLLCCDLSIDFVTKNTLLKQAYLEKISQHPDIENLGRLPREKFLTEVLAKANCYLLPSYNEAFGFALLEALAHGVPVVTTNTMAFPEIVEPGTGQLIDISHINNEALFKGYKVDQIPASFMNYMIDEIHQAMVTMLTAGKKYETMRSQALEVAREKFSLARRRAIMNEVYHHALV